jgi:CubicO group peptidase (beta-lactamase class C family)
MRALFLIANLLLGLSCMAQTARMNKIVESYVSSKQFMGSVLVARGNQVLLSKGYGQANLEWNIPNAPATRFRIASVTKQFTAACVLLLEERGKLRIEDLVNKYLSNPSKVWEKVTILDLLTHSSGIVDFTELPEYRSLEPLEITPGNLVALFRDNPLEFEPGQQAKYSNSGYVLLGLMIEEISGKTYGRFVQENIFAPLGMRDSGYDSNSAIIANRAAGYQLADGALVNARFIHMTVPFAAGGLYSTTEDLLRWEQGLFGGKVLGAAALKKMTTAYNGDNGLGLQVWTSNGRRAIEHSGVIEGFTSHLAYFPEDKVTVVVLSNLQSSAPPMISRQLGLVAHGEVVTLESERKEVSLDAALLPVTPVRTGCQRVATC